jgi:hydroxyethylthiazole kinase-like uncharacterized protein yjeF
MIPVLTQEEAYKLDKDTIESGHLSQEELMDNAGKAIAQFFCENIDDPFNKKVVVVCGKGNNGGDGVIAHSYLKQYNVSSEIIFTEEKHGHSKIFKKYKISKSEYSNYNDKTKFNQYDWVIDGIFGIGLSRKLDDRYWEIIDRINTKKHIISIDVPSGISDSPLGGFSKFVISKYTVTFGYSKLAHYMNPINNIVVSDIGFKNLNKINMCKIIADDIQKILIADELKSNKHKKYTECNIYAGGYQYPGAAFLCSMAAHKTGSGYVRLYYGNLGKKEHEVLLENIKALMPEIIVESEYEINNVFLNEDTPMLIGPGGTTLSSFEENIHSRLVIDASAISFFDDEKSVSDNICEIPEYSIMTPHVGEFKSFFQLINIEYSDIQNIQKIIGERIVILKSFNTFIITKDIIYIMDKGPNLLATAGTGDVLSGILVSLLSQGYSRLDASILGTYLHAEAANYYMNNISKDGMTASDLIDCIPHAFNILRVNE